MYDINTRNKLIDTATQYFFPILTKCEDFDTFAKYVHREMDKIKTDVIRKCLVNFDNELREELPNDWSIIRKEKRTIICIFGKIKFQRTVFLDQYGRRRYLCDELLGIAPKSRFSSDAFIWLMNTITKLSYGKTVKAFEEISGVKISKMAIWNMVQKEAKLIEEHAYKCPNDIITQENICIEADGIFIALQSPTRRKEAIERFFYQQQHHKKSIELKCSCIYAGKITENNRTRRVNVDLVGGCYSPNELRNRIVKNIKDTYDIKYLNKIYYASDAGGWCKNHGLDIDNNLNAHVYQSIDKYHVMQAIWNVFPKGKVQDKLVSLINNKKPEKFIKVLNELLPKLNGNKKAKAKKLIKYVSNNIELIHADFNLGTMEGTNAHVWARRMKHIGGAWSVHGGHAMAVLLAHVYSGNLPIPPLKNVLFSAADMIKKEKVLAKLSSSVGNIKSVGSGYELPIGHIPHIRNKEIFIPSTFNYSY